MTILFFRWGFTACDSLVHGRWKLFFLIAVWEQLWGCFEPSQWLLALWDSWSDTWSHLGRNWRGLFEDERSRSQRFGKGLSGLERPRAETRLWPIRWGGPSHAWLCPISHRGATGSPSEAHISRALSEPWRSLSQEIVFSDLYKDEDLPDMQGSGKWARSDDGGMQEMRGPRHLLWDDGDWPWDVHAAGFQVYRVQGNWGHLQWPWSPVQDLYGQETLPRGTLCLSLASSWRKGLGQDLLSWGRRSPVRRK